jgi:hypothetical protein
MGAFCPDLKIFYEQVFGDSVSFDAQNVFVCPGTHCGCPNGQYHTDQKEN